MHSDELKKLFLEPILNLVLVIIHGYQLNYYTQRTVLD